MIFCGFFNTYLVTYVIFFVTLSFPRVASKEAPPPAAAHPDSDPEDDESDPDEPGAKSGRKKRGKTSKKAPAAAKKAKHEEAEATGLLYSASQVSGKCHVLFSLSRERS